MVAIYSRYSIEHLRNILALYDFMEKGKWYETSDLRRALGISPIFVNRYLAKLHKMEEIEYMPASSRRLKGSKAPVIEARWMKP